MLLNRNHVKNITSPDMCVAWFPHYECDLVGIMGGSKETTSVFGL